MDSASPNPDTTTPTPEATMAGRTNPTTTAQPDPDPPGARLRPTQRRFAELVALGTPKQAAYAEAYPKAKPSTARRESGDLIRKPQVLRYIQHLRDTGMAEAELTTADIAKALKRIAFFDYSTVCLEDGSILPVSMWPKGAGEVIQGITAKGEAKIPDRISAFRTLAEMRGALGQGRDKGAEQPKATFVFNFGGKGKAARPKVVLGERLADQDDVANVAPVSPRLIDTTREVEA